MFFLNTQQSKLMALQSYFNKYKINFLKKKNSLYYSEFKNKKQ